MLPEKLYTRFKQNNKKELSKNMFQNVSYCKTEKPEGTSNTPRTHPK